MNKIQRNTSTHSSVFFSQLGGFSRVLSSTRGFAGESETFFDTCHFEIFLLKSQLFEVYSGVFGVADHEFDVSFTKSLKTFEME